MPLDRADELRGLRAEVELLRQMVGRLASDSPTDDKVMLARAAATATGTGTGSPAYRLVHPVRIRGPQVEGGSPTLQEYAAVLVPALSILGGSTAGDYLIVRQAGPAWIGGDRTNRPSCAGHNNTLGLTLTGCTLIPVPGATVTFTGTTASYSRSTDSLGLASVVDPDPGTYTLHWTFGSYSKSTMALITDACSSDGLTDNLLNTGRVGYNSCCPGCMYPLPDRVFLTDALGSHTLNRGINGWTGFYQQEFPGPPGSGSTYVLTVNYVMSCTGVTVQWNYAVFVTAGGGGCTAVNPCDPANPAQHSTPPGQFGPVGCFYDLAQGGSIDICTDTFPGLSGTWPDVGGCGWANPAAGAWGIVA